MWNVIQRLLNAGHHVGSTCAIESIDTSPAALQGELSLNPNLDDWAASPFLDLVATKHAWEILQQEALSSDENKVEGTRVASRWRNMH